MIRKIATIAFVATVVLLNQYSFAQLIQNDCSKNMRKTAPANIDSLLLVQKGSIQQLDFTLPIIIKLFVVVFADTDGSSVAADEADIRRQIGNMQSYYAPRNICFVLGTIRQVNSSTLNVMDADEEESLLDPYIQNGFITIFIHRTLFNDDGGLNGIAYGIPNYYMSMEGSAVADTVNLSTMAHEMGHCFGLYHTFETANGNENVARSGDCRNCEDNGDYLCDTQADREVDATFVSATTCEYTGRAQDACGVQYIGEGDNIMTYGRRSCRTRFSSGQGSRARGMINSDSDLSAAVAADSRTIVLGFTTNSGFVNLLARNSVTLDASNNNYTQTAKVVASAKAIVVKPGTTFRPGDGGYAKLVVNPYCN